MGVNGFRLDNASVRDNRTWGVTRFTYNYLFDCAPGLMYDVFNIVETNTDYSRNACITVLVCNSIKDLSRNVHLQLIKVTKIRINFFIEKPFLYLIVFLL